MIRSVPYLTQNVISKNFDRLGLLYKVILQNSKINPVLFHQLNNNEYSQIMKIWLHYYELQLALAQYFSKSSGFSRVCHKPVWLTNDLSVVVPSNNFHGFSDRLSEANIYWNLLCFFATSKETKFTESVSKRSSTML